VWQCVLNTGVSGILRCKGHTHSDSYHSLFICVGLLLTYASCHYFPRDASQGTCEKEATGISFLIHLGLF